MFFWFCPKGNKESVQIVDWWCNVISERPHTKKTCCFILLKFLISCSESDSAYSGTVQGWSLGLTLMDNCWGSQKSPLLINLYSPTAFGYWQSLWVLYHNGSAGHTETTPPEPPFCYHWPCLNPAILYSQWQSWFCQLLARTQLWLSLEQAENSQTKR